MRCKLIFSCILALAVFPVSAEVYKWKTESGEIEYGQFPPAGVQAERMTSGGLKAVPQPEPEDAGEQAGGENGAPEAAPAAPQQDPQVLEEEQANAARQEAEQQRQCAEARDDLAVLQQGGNRRVRLPDGTVTHLTAEQRAQRIAAAKQFIETSCD